MRARILPMPGLDAERYVSLFLTNPLLLAAHPDRMRATAESWAAGGYDQVATVALSNKLSELRHAIRLSAPAEPEQREAERELLDLASHPLIAKAERVRLQEKIYASRPSEYDWLRAILNAAILQLSEERDSRALELQAPPTPRRQLLLDVATTATRATGVPVVLASQLAA